MFFVTLIIVSLAVLLPNVFVYAAPNRLHSTTIRHSPSQINAFLFAHNTVRAAHNATALTWSTEYAALAEIWADQCEMKYTGGVLSATQYGEHHAAATGDFPISAAVALFTQDAPEYDPAFPTYNHFTQVVWKSTTEVGCARSQCDGIFSRLLGRTTYHVCLYNPAGNIIGQALMYKYDTHRHGVTFTPLLDTFLGQEPSKLMLSARRLIASHSSALQVRDFRTSHQ